MGLTDRGKNWRRRKEVRRDRGTWATREAEEAEAPWQWNGSGGGTWGAGGWDGALLAGSSWERARVAEEELCSGELVTRWSGRSSPGAMDGNSYGTETKERDK